MNWLAPLYLTIAGICGFLVWCVIGLLILRSKIGLGEGINILAGDGMPKSALALMIVVIVLWPLYLVWLAWTLGSGYFQMWREKKAVTWKFTMPRKTNDLIKGIMERECIGSKKEYMQRCMGMHDYLTEKKNEGYKLYLKKDDETEYHELELP